MPTKIMIIRHGEKPSKDGTIQGVDPWGAVDPESLAVRGWQRAGALSRFFASADPNTRPTALFAAAASSADSSKRPIQTVTELGLMLPSRLSEDFSVGQEAQVAAAALEKPGVVLIAWEHKAIHLIGDAIVGDDHTVPRKWDGTRFDLIYIFTPSETGWSFEVKGQFLLSGDSAPDATP